MKKGQVSITLICFILGIMLVIQMKSVQNLGGLITPQKADQLLVNISRIKRDNNHLEQNIDQLKKEIRIIENKASDNNALIDTNLNKVRTAKDQSGYSTITGSGLEITLDYQGDPSSNPFQMFPQLILSLINDINSTGAKAISINNERFVHSTGILFASDHYKINGKKLTPPYTIKVVGDPQKIKSAINIHYGTVDQMKDHLMDVVTKEYNRITVKEYKGAIDIKYAKPINK